MLEVLHNFVPLINSGERTRVAQKVDSLFRHGRWGFRYDPKNRDQWRRIGEEYRRMKETDREDFLKHLYSQSPAEQYAVLELLSQPAFGSDIQGEVKPHIEPKEIGELYAGLIYSHFAVPSGPQEVVQEVEKRKNEFIDNVWRLTVPQTALMFTVLKIAPDLSSPSFTEEVIPYVQCVVNNMGEQTKKNLGSLTRSQLEVQGVFVGSYDD